MQKLQLSLSDHEFETFEGLCNTRGTKKIDTFRYLLNLVPVHLLPNPKHPVGLTTDPPEEDVPPTEKPDGTPVKFDNFEDALDALADEAEQKDEKNLGVALAVDEAMWDDLLKMKSDVVTPPEPTLPTVDETTNKIKWIAEKFESQGSDNPTVKALKLVDKFGVEGAVKFVTEHL